MSNAKQAADRRPEPSVQRKAAIAHGAALDHSGAVRVSKIRDFDLDRTIFQTLEGRVARYVMRTRVGKEVQWAPPAQRAVSEAYEAVQEPALPAVDPKLMTFLVEECDFDVEHADGSFLDHLYFCFEYSARHYPEQSPLVMLLHSILGTGTNTFAMEASKIPALQPLMSSVEWAQTEAFPSVLRLLYSGEIREEMRESLLRGRSLESIRFQRVIDNAPIEMTGDQWWVALNYQLVHLVDFLPVANWSVHRNDTSFILFRDLYDLLGRAGQRVARIDYQPATGSRRPVGEKLGVGSWLTTRIPVRLSEKMASKSVNRFSERIGHSLAYSTTWR